MIKAFKDSHKINVLLAVLFLLGIALSAYALYRLPYNLMIPYDFQSVFTNVYLIIGLTLLIGAVAVTQALRYKKELVVYRDRENDISQADKDAAEDKKNIVSAESVKAALRLAKSKNDILLNGLQSVCKQLDAGQGVAYLVHQENDTRFVELVSGFALTVNENSTTRYNFGEGLIGQAAAGGQLLYLDEVPEGYIKIISGLGSASPRYLVIAPMKHNDQVLGVLEIASFAPFNAEQRKFVEQGAQLIAEKLSN